MAAERPFVVLLPGPDGRWEVYDRLLAPNERTARVEAGIDAHPDELIAFCPDDLRTSGYARRSPRLEPGEESDNH